MVLDNFFYLPAVSTPDDHLTGILVQPNAARNQQKPTVALGHTRNFVGMPVELIHFGPECVLDQVVIIRGNSKVNLNLFRPVLFVIFLNYLFLFIVVI